jgi:hypothetical protein
MPFKIERLWDNGNKLLKRKTNKKFLLACDSFRKLTSPQQKAAAVRGIMELLDQNVPTAKRIELMQSCGRNCLGASILNKAIRLQKQADDIDDLLRLFNESNIGGGNLRRKGNIIYAEYFRCYCGAVSKTKTKFSPTYCQCSCGWLRQLFETVFQKPVKVELLDSIIQGGNKCRFKIHLRD